MQILYKLQIVNNVFTLKLYNGNWLLDVVTATLRIKNDICLSSRQILLFFCRRTCCMYIYLYIDVAMCLLAIVEILRITLLIIENAKDTSPPNRKGID